MVRIKRGFSSKNRRKKILRYTKSFRGTSKNLLREANQKTLKALCNNYKDRKIFKRLTRQLWISRISATANLNGSRYSYFIHYFRKKNYKINRKIISQLCLYDRESFLEIF